MNPFRSALVIAASAAFALAAAPAVADDTEPPPDFTSGTTIEAGLPLSFPGEPVTRPYTYAVADAAGDSLAAYCLDFDQRYRHGAGLSETTLGAAPRSATHAAELNWLLHQSYPFVPLDEIWPGAGFNDGLSAREAITATQAAVWHYTNGLHLTDANVAGTPAQRQDVLALYGHLTGAANLGQDEIPHGTLSLTSAVRGGLAGEPIGPLTLDASDPTSLTAHGAPEGVRLTDADGTVLGEDLGSTEFYIDVPADAEAGAVTITAQADTDAMTSRVFVPVDGPGATQPLVAASTKTYPMLATITIPWLAAPVPDDEEATPAADLPPQDADDSPDTEDTDDGGVPDGGVPDDGASDDGAPDEDIPPTDGEEPGLGAPNEPDAAPTAADAGPAPNTPAQPANVTPPSDAPPPGDDTQGAGVRGSATPTVGGPAAPGPTSSVPVPAGATTPDGPATLAGPQLADTGLDVTPWALLSTAALLAGIGVALLARRGRAAQ